MQLISTYSWMKTRKDLGHLTNLETLKDISQSSARFLAQQHKTLR